MKGFSDAGDGWMTAIAGAMAAMVTIAALLSNVRGQLVASAIAICGLLIACVAGYCLIHEWDGPRPNFLVLLPVFAFEVHRQPGPWATAAAGLAIAIAGFALLAAATRRQRFADGPNEQTETGAWA